MVSVTNGKATVGSIHLMGTRNMIINGIIVCRKEF